MFEKNLAVVFKYANTAMLIAVFTLFVLLRLINLGYSEYIPDETTVMTPIKNGEISKDFLLAQRKGPMQFLAVWVVNIFNISVFDEFTYRVPFFFASVLGLLFFYKFIKNMEGQFVAVVATLFLGLNGMLIAFGRVVQYQSLNLLFSSAGLYFLSLLKNEEHRIRNSILGSLFLTLSAMSHWDAIFVIPPALFLICKYVLFAPLRGRQKRSIIGALSLPVLVIFMPFFINYSSVALSEPENISYFKTRVGRAEVSLENIMYNLKEYISKIELYNPFMYLYALGTLAFAGLVGSKRAYSYFYWFLLSLATFIFFVVKPGTHIYNIFYPLVILAAFGAQYFYQLFKGLLSKTVVVLLIVLFSFFGYQGYLLFADPSVDYPWSQEDILGYKTRPYSQRSLPNNIIGFPIYRGWEEAAEFLTGENARNGSDLPYITNEESSIGGFYLPLRYGRENEYYAIGVKRPLSFVNDYTFPSIKNKKTVKRIEVYGENTMRIYRVTVNE
ncbi:hypothetical protein A2380_03230 [candidate division WWE3 bacterium RIFOXYB1_FULL_43_24]|uniref:Glycosyl transferase family 39 n=2 Tax=Katanobacteria TaxID=422282 RepID=A0A0G0YN91_UNCKA|nr:MAG: Glycosyl transferase family 39 [candidate division WWE3 bacterium GW2011_GWA1_42_12]KKS34769.1 MAG: Glycosyl transferase family 39 [candidate division WWE3 bacterium GW2011_GWD1_42_14]KKS38192.1 MAG: Glycosyl transferase family 39 [candidate division WWE3 bacterium GW2011_GWF1_42_14]KKS40329.1 MAG: Glycosyl transferase family 39 [candidate division WWE3 bacterium GW2011_GWE1_42_16]KKS67164.1 MAG: Glycosyl transferase family 39 [candidate division WWE3 bacterium GW2011_GWB1_42_6]OGC5991